LATCGRLSIGSPGRGRNLHVEPSRPRARIQSALICVNRRLDLIELKAGSATFDRLDTLSRLTDQHDDYREAGETTVRSAQPKKRAEPLCTDLFKLLDPKLPEHSFRISWIALRKRGWATEGDLRQRAIRIVQAVAKGRNLSGATYAVDPETSWLVCTWTYPQLVRLELAWYQPKVDTPSACETVFAVDS
jgi:hypothetical protein